MKRVQYILPKQLIPKLPLIYILSPGSTERVHKSQSQKTKQEKRQYAVLISTYIYIHILSQKIFVYVQNHLSMCKQKCDLGEDEITSSIVSTVWSLRSYLDF
jgi:hypothetical protein